MVTECDFGCFYCSQHLDFLPSLPPRLLPHPQRLDGAGTGRRGFRGGLETDARRTAVRPQCDTAAGIRKAKRGDVLVFNFPHPNGWDKIEMHILKYYIKRCIGLPGDTLSIRNGRFRINGTNEPLGNMDSQERIGRTLPGEFPDGVYKAFPFDSVISWNIRNFGPLYVPKAGDKVEMNRENYLLYRKLIAWEQKAEINYNDSTVFLNGEPIREYRFLKNYYFMAGDKGLNSQGGICLEIGRSVHRAVPLGSVHEENRIKMDKHGNKIHRHGTQIA